MFFKKIALSLQPQILTQGQSLSEVNTSLFNSPEQMIRYACLLLDTADENRWVFDELIQEQRGTTYWIHFAVRPKDNRRKILFDCR